MRLVCLSAANIKHARTDSTSIRVCRIIGELLQEKHPGTFQTETIALADYELTPCIGCGQCFQAGVCDNDSAFNAIYQRLATADGLFVVSAHYAPIPAKLVMLLEKMEQIAFLPRFHDDSKRSPLHQKPVGIIGHGGGTEEVYRSYRGVVIDSIANALGYPIEMDVIGAGEEWPRGVAFPIAIVRKADSSPFPVQIYDWDDVRKRIAPLVYNVAEKLHPSRS